MLGGVINQFLFDVQWDNLDYLIIDLPPGTGDIQLSLSQNVELHGTIVISTPQDVALLDSKKGLNMFKKVKVPIIGMVENMGTFICDQCDKVHTLFGDGGVEKTALDLGTNFLGSIPFLSALREGSDIGSPYMNQSNVKDSCHKSFMKIAKKVDEIVLGKKKSKFPWPFSRI